MKHIILSMVAAAGTLSAVAQAPQPRYNADSSLSRWVLDVNLMGGLSNQDFTANNSTSNYLNAVNANPGTLKYSKGFAYGADAQLGFFFGKKRHFGIGAGFMYLMQQGDVSLDGYHVEYQSRDYKGSTFRQVITGSNLTENLKITNMNIPVMLKYKNRFSKHWGFATDLGVLVNMQMKSAYTTKATFDYEAIYKLQKVEGVDVAVYDNSPTPSTGDWLITKQEFLRNNSEGNLQDYFATKRALGYSVGLGLPAGTTKGNVSYTKYSVGFMVKPSFNYFLSDGVALDFGAYYLFQPFKNDAAPAYRLTDGGGNYSSGLNNVTASNNQSYGVNLGVRFFLGNKKDRDHDGVVDKKDKCPDVFGVAKFDGCPDTDGDGVPDNMDSCVLVPGLAQYHGCPDSDGDSIIDKDDLCPYNAGPRSLRGCPDRDKDGILDKDDQCPDVFGLAKYRGCPDTDGDGLPDNEDKCPEVAGPISNQGCPLDPPKPPVEAAKPEIDAPILFETNEATIAGSYFPQLDEAAKQLKEDKGLYIIVDGHADTTGLEMKNKGLSLRRANAVKAQLIKRGVSAGKVKTVGHGSSIPEESNKTPDGRQENRRAVMTIVPVKN